MSGVPLGASGQDRRHLLRAAIGSVLGCGVLLLVAMWWAGRLSEEVGGMAATGYGYGAVFLLLAAVLTLLLGGVALLLHRRPVGAGLVCAVAGAVVVLGGGLGLTAFGGEWWLLAAVPGAAVVVTGVVASHRGTATPR